MRGCSPHALPFSLQSSTCIRSIVSTSSRHGPTSSLSISHGLPSPARALSIFSGCCTLSQCFEAVQGIGLRHYSSKRWVQRQSQDPFAKAARVAGLKSRAAFKLLQINDRYRLFKPGQTVVDLGFAPGSWSQVRLPHASISPRATSAYKNGQVAIDLTKPTGRILGVDLIPTQPPKGVSTIQGDFLSPSVQTEIKNFLRDPDRGRLRRPLVFTPPSEDTIREDILSDTTDKSYLELEREDSAREEEEERIATLTGEHEDKCVDVVLSDMSEPWDLLDGFYKRSISNPYRRLMNTSGNAFRDHAGSMV